MTLYSKYKLHLFYIIRMIWVGWVSAWVLNTLLTLIWGLALIRGSTALRLENGYFSNFPKYKLRDVFRTQPNMSDVVFLRKEWTAENLWLFSEESLILDVQLVYFYEAHGWENLEQHNHLKNISDHSSVLSGTEKKRLYVPWEMVSIKACVSGNGKSFLFVSFAYGQVGSA